MSKKKEAKTKHKLAGCLHQIIRNFKNGYTKAKETNREENGECQN